MWATRVPRIYRVGYAVPLSTKRVGYVVPRRGGDVWATITPRNSVGYSVPRPQLLQSVGY